MEITGAGVATAGAGVVTCGAGVMITGAGVRVMGAGVFGTTGAAVGVAEISVGAGIVGLAVIGGKVEGAGAIVGRGIGAIGATVTGAGVDDTGAEVGAILIPAPLSHQPSYPLKSKSCLALSGSVASTSAAPSLIGAESTLFVRRRWDVCSFASIPR